MNEQYEKFEVIGSGRNTTVYEGHDHGPLDRAVAIKELSSPANEDERRLAAFFAEAKFLANLDNEHLLKVYDVCQTSNLVITELLEGSLSGLIRDQGPMSSDRVRSVVQQVLKALNYLHRKNVLYGKIRPSKLLYSDRGRVKLSCFEQIEGGIVPKPEDEKYVAPETLSTEFGEIGPPLDFYCLGFSALELLLGQKFEEVFPVITGTKGMSSVAWLRWHSSPDPMPPVKKLVPRIADDLATALDAMLKKPVAERPQTAIEVFKLLQDTDPIPIIDGVEDSISLSGHRLRGASGRAETDLPGTATETSRDQAAGSGKTAGTDQAGAKRGSRPGQRPAGKAPSASATDRVAGEKKRSVAGTLANALIMLLLLGGIGFGGWWTYTNDPFGWFATPVAAATTAAVSFDFEPADIGDVQVIDDGDPLNPDDDGKWILPFGDHTLEFRAGEFQATQRISVDEHSESFNVLLAKTTPIEPGEFEVKFTVDPVGAELVVDGKTLATSNGFASANFDGKRKGETIKVSAQHAGYEPAQIDLELESSDVNHIALNPLLMVKPMAAKVTLDEKPLEQFAAGQFLLPRDQDTYRLAVSHNGYTSYENAELTFDKLKAQKFTIELTPDIDTVFKMGKQALVDKKHAEAIEHFSVVLEHDHAKYLVAFLLRAKAHLGRNAGHEDVHHAIEDLTAFLSEPNSTATGDEKAEAHLIRARINRAEGHVDKAVVDYRAADALRPDDAVKRELAALLVERATKYLTEDKLDPAIADFEEAKKLDPSLSDIDAKLAEAIFVRGKQKLSAKDFGAAKDDFNRAVELVDSQPKYYVGRASLYRKINETQNALKDLDKAIQLAPTEPAAFVIRGQLYRKDLKQFSDAIGDFRSALKNGAKPPFEINLAIGETFNDAGESMFGKRKVNDALTQFQESLKQLQLMQRDSSATADQKSRLAQEVPDVIRRVGDCYYASKDYSRGIELYTRAIDQGGDKDHVARARRGNCYKFEGEFGKSEQDLRRALAIDKTYTIAHYYIAQLFIKSGDEKAKRRFTVPSQEQAMLRARAIGDYKAAISELEKLIGLDPQNRHYDLMIAAWTQLNVIDTSPVNASQIQAWKQKQQARRSN